MSEAENTGTRAEGTTRSPAYLAVVRRLKSHIAENGLKIGDSLPTERVMAQSFGVSRHSLREALRVLQEQGILAPQQGSGNYVASTNIEFLEENLRAETGAGAAERNKDIFAFREMMEPEIAAMAASVVKERELEELEKIVAQQERETEARTLRLLDDAFHLGLANATGNHVVANVIRSINAVVGQVRSEAYQGPQRNRISLEGHQEILAAIRAREPQLARQAMQNHIARIRGFVMDDEQ